MYGQEIRWNLPGRQRRIVAFSDLHFCQNVAKHRAKVLLATLQRVCREEQIDYIFCLGDLINALGVLADTWLRLELKCFLDELAKLAPVIIVTGNHDLSDYTVGPNQGKMYPEQWYRWARTIMRNHRIHVLDMVLDGDAIFDDGVMRVLGMTLPGVCYPTKLHQKCDPVKAFQEYSQCVLPELTRVVDREYYLLLHNPQFLSTIQLDKRVAVLAGHMHNGLVPPILDELTRFTDRGLVTPGYYTRSGCKRSYIPFGRGARYWPRVDRPWLTLNSCTHLPPESWLWHLDGMFPALSYAIITGDGPEESCESRYFRL